MSEWDTSKVTPLHPERFRRRRFRRRLRWLIIVTVIVLAVLALVLFWRDLNFDRFRRWVTYMGVEPDGTYGNYQFPAYDSNVYAVYENGLLVATSSGLMPYDESGYPLTDVNATMENPNVNVAGNYAAAWDIGGTTLCAVRNGMEHLNRVLDHTILDVDLSANGDMVFASGADGYRTMLTMMDNQTQERFKWYSSAQYLPLCAVDSGGTQLAAIALGQEQGAFTSSLLLLDPTVEEQEPVQIALGNQLIYELDYLQDRYLCAVGETSLQLLRTTGEIYGTYGYNGEHLMKYDINGDGFVTLALNPYQTGSQYVLKTVEYDGQERASLALGQEVLHLSAAGDYVAVLTASGLQIYTSDLQLYAQTDDILGITQVLMREVGTAVLVAANHASLFLP